MVRDDFGVSGSSSPYLHTDDQTDDGHSRFLVEPEGADCRIITKATGRYVRADSDKFITSRYNVKDDSSLFALESV